MVTAGLCLGLGGWLLPRISHGAARSAAGLADGAAGVTVTVTPAELPADGAAEAVVSATAQDAAGLPLPDGTLVRFATDLGTLTPSGAAAEAEALDVAGEWGIYNSQTFGPFTGKGYRRSRQPGAQLAWHFDAPALLVRYGRLGPDATANTTGTFEVQVDGTSAGVITTTGDASAWVDRVFDGLAPAARPHTATLTVLAGEVNLDAVAAGTVLRAGFASAHLRAGEAVGTAHVQAVAHAPGGWVTGTASVPFVPGPPTKLELRAAAAQLAAGGMTTTLVAEPRDARDRLTGNGSEVRFESSLGSIDPPTATVLGGQAHAVLTSGESRGMSTLTATLGALTATAFITITSGPPDSVIVTPSLEALPANSVSTLDLWVDVRDRWGQPVVDGTTVRVTSTLGTVEPPNLLTAAGMARTRLRAGNVAGTAIVRVAAGDSGALPSATAEFTVGLVAQDVRLTKTVEPRLPVAVIPGEPIIYTLAFSNAGDGAVYDLELTDPLPTGVISPSINYDGRVPLQSLSRCPDCRWRISRLRPGEGGVLQIAGVVDPGLRAAKAVTLSNTAQLTSSKAAEASPDDNIGSADVQVIPTAAYSVTVEAPARLPVGGATARIVTHVLDPFGRPIRDGTEIYFSTDLGIISPITVKTQAGVAAATLTSGRSTGLATIKAVLSVDNRAGLAQVRFDPGAPDTLGLAAQRERLMVGGETTALTVTLRDAFGNPVPSTLVLFESDQGQLSAVSGQTDADGVTATSLRSGFRAVTATVSARVQALVQSLAIPFDPGPVANIGLTVTPSRLIVGGKAAVLAAVTDGFGNPIARTLVNFSTALGSLRPRAGYTDEAGTVSSVFTSSRPGTGSIRAAVAGVFGVAEVTVERGELYLPALRRAR